MNPLIPLGGILIGVWMSKMHMLKNVTNPEQILGSIPYDISIVMCALNEQDYIQQSLESLKNQHLFNCNCRERFDEIVVVDNMSEDRTAEIAEAYGCRVVKAPRGKLFARNVGVAEARGDIIVCVDADNYYPPNWLYLLCRHFNNPEVVVVAGSVFSEARTPLYVKIGRTFFNMINGMVNWLPSSNSAFRKDAFLKAGGFNEDVDQKNLLKVWIEEEWNFLSRLSSFGSYVYDSTAVCFTSSRRYSDKDFQKQIATVRM